MCVFFVCLRICVWVRARVVCVYARMYAVACVAVCLCLHVHPFVVSMGAPWFLSNTLLCTPQPIELPLPLLANGFETLRGDTSRAQVLCSVLYGLEMHAAATPAAVLEVVSPRLEALFELLVMGEEDRKYYLLDSSGKHM